MDNYFGGQLPGKVDDYIFRSKKYIGDFTLAGFQLLSAQRIVLLGTALYFVLMRLMQVATSTVWRCALYTDDQLRVVGGSLAALDRVRSECLFGTASRPGVLPVPILIPGAGNIVLDLEDVSGAPNALHLVFEGVEIHSRQ